MELGNGDKRNENISAAAKENGRIEIDSIDDPHPAVESINRILRQMSSCSSSECSIYRVPEPLRSIKSEAYTPTLISIGPIHSDKKDLRANRHKRSHLQNFFDLAKLSLQTIVELVQSLEGRVRNCYAERIDMPSDQFVELLVLDGCFVVMYLICSQFSELRVLDTSNLWTVGEQIFCDLLLLENQLPFFVLNDLYDLCASSNRVLKELSFIELACAYFIIESRDDILDFLENDSSVYVGRVNHFVDLLRIHFVHTCPQKGFFPQTFWPPTVTELHQCGVSFKTDKEKKFAVDIAFVEGGSGGNGDLELPQIIIYDGYEMRVRNLIAYEQCGGSDMSNEVRNFAMFMQCLVQTNQDVSLLIEGGVIENNLGSVNEVTQIFNNLCKHVGTGRNNLYNRECQRMNRYCKSRRKYYKRRRYRWMTSLRQNYCSTPWACASSVAAILLLALTFVQTVVAVVALYKSEIKNL